METQKRDEIVSRRRDKIESEIKPMIKVIKKSGKETEQSFDTLIVEIPKDFAVSHGLPEKSFATLTMQNGKIISEVISYSDEDEKEVEEFLAQFPKFDEEMKRVGD